MLAILQPWQKTLLEAAEIIKTQGWCQHASMTLGGRVCLLGAVALAKNGYIAPGGLSDLPVEVRLLVTSTGVPNADALVDWNNAPERTADEVIKALKDAALT
jgi:hypothetical protein